MHVGQRIQQKMIEKHLSQNRLAKMAQISQSGLSSVISGVSSPKEVTLVAIADALGCSVSELLGESPPGIIGMKKRVIPIVGEIACGTPITAEENIEGYADLPSGVHADFALRCKGDSMAPTFENNDLVLIRQQPDVLDGQIAAVDVACEATLKHVYHQASGLLLVSDNPAYPPISVSASEEIIIHGLAVGYVRMFKR